MITFVGLASRFVLNKRLEWEQWAGVGVISSGVLLVGAADLFSRDNLSASYQPLIGDMIIVFAQVSSINFIDHNIG